MKHQGSKGLSLAGIVIVCIFFAVTLALAAQEGIQDPSVESADPGFYYTIQKGDTLWDLSRKFYNSQWDWPGLWEMNKEIKNPHWIYPGKKIRVFLKPDTPVPQPLPPAPPQTAEPAPAPPPIIPTFSYPALDRIGFIRETAVKSQGRIIRERDGNLMMTVDDIIYLKPSEKGSLVPGTTYQIFNTEAVEEKIDGKRFKGVKHIIKAEVEILENTTGYSVGKITRAYRDVTTDDLLMAFYTRPHEFEIQEVPDPLDAALVCSEDNTVMINDYRIAFINRGTNANVRPGQIYAINQSQQNRSVYDGKDSLDLEPLFSGRLIVLHVEEISSTVMVLSSKRDIHPGDLVN